MSLSSAPGAWRWEDRSERGWWRVHDALAIEDGPHRLDGPNRLWSIRACIVCGRSVKCEPGYPAEIRVVCWPCIQGESRL